MPKHKKSTPGYSNTSSYKKENSSDRTTEGKNKRKADTDENGSFSKEVNLPSSSTNPEKKRRRIVYSEDEDYEGKLKIKEVYGDLFDAPKDHSLAHCIAADMRMGSGIAVNFRQCFGRIGELLDQKKYIGDVAVLSDGDRFIYNLVTKRFSYGKPKISDLESSLIKMREHCEENGVKNLSMPRIGCGLDKLEWIHVRASIEKAFHSLNITITVHDFTPPRKSYRKPLLHIEKQKINYAYIPPEIPVLFYTCEDSTTSSDIFYLLRFLNLNRHFIYQHKKLERVIRLSTCDHRCLFGLVVRKSMSHSFSFSNFEKCLTKILGILTRQQIQNIAFESLNDEFMMTKVTSVINHVFEFSNLVVYFCKSGMGYNRQWGRGGQHR